VTAPRSDRRWVQGALRVGLALGGLLLAAGFLLALVRGERVTGAASPWHLLATGPLPDRLMSGGMLLLAATPVARVGVLVAVWVRERDHRFAALALLVLAILVVSALTAAAG
jgi:uncharacterized membrane protein